jgi:23S rRNA (pseudouridine1915-N3)-methyltransferase
MNLHILAIGKKKSEYDEMIQEYKKRIVAPFDLSLEILPESEKLLGKIKSSDYVIALDEKGKDFTTVAFSQVLEKQLHASSKRIVFIIGEAHGLTEEMRTRANLLMCLGKLTLPHELARLVLAEQLYRVTNLLGGGKYHHE